MTPIAESQGLAQGFNDTLVSHDNDEAAELRPRPDSEARNVNDEIAAEREAYDRRHSVEELRDRRDGEPARFEKPAAAEKKADPWADVTKADIATALHGAGVEHADLAAYDKSDKKVSKAQLVALAEANGMQPVVEETPAS